MSESRETILIFDFGSQFAQLIARRVRDLNVYSQIVRHDLPTARVRELAPKGIIFSGGPASVYDANALQCDPAIFELNIPILGICYGMQLICQAYGGTVAKAAAREYGPATMTIMEPGQLFRGFPSESLVWMSHGDQVEALPAELITLATTETCRHAAVQHRSRPIFGLQFHPEVSHTTHGSQIFANFLRDVCGCGGRWKMSSFIDDTVAELRAVVGSERVICGLSGGVDSAVCAAILLKAIGKQVTCIYVDTGMMREGETELVRHTFRDWFQADLRVVNAREQFFTTLRGIKEPQEKRRRIGHTFIEVFKQEARSIAGAKFLAQGTLYPDVIESGGARDGTAATIKTHHNVGGLPAELGFDLIEPLRDLFKDEVRRLGQELGLPEDVIWRHPFPGPGLAVRCLGEVTEEKLEILRKADAIFLEELHRSGWYKKVSQAFAVLLPVQSVGVMGDGRTYENTIALRAVNTEDFMTADWSRLPGDLLAQVSTAIINRVRGVNRVVYDISSKPPATIEWE